MAESQQVCTERWHYCQSNPYETDAFLAYEQAVENYWEALRIADPERYAIVRPRYLKINAAYPHNFFQALERLRHGDREALELPIRILEADPWVEGSGYAKEQIIRLLNRLELPHHYILRLQNVVLTVIRKADGRREFRSYCRLARKVDSEAFRQELETLRLDFDPRINRRAQWALNACRQK